MGFLVFVVESRVPQGRVWTLFLVGLGASIYFGSLLAASSRFRDKARMLSAVAE
jgi:hypothetical protein